MSIKKLATLLCVFYFITLPISSQGQDLGSEYIDNWKSFYPSRALSRGINSSIFEYEDRSLERIERWLAYNKKTLNQLSDPSSNYQATYPIDSRLLRVQLQSEIDKWQTEQPHRNGLATYASLIANSLDKVLESDFLTAPEKNRLVCDRLAAVEQLSISAIATVKNINKENGERSLARLERAIQFYDKELPDIMKGRAETCSDYEKRRLAAVKRLQELVSYTKTTLLPSAKASSPILGREEYARRLRLYTDSDLTPEELQKMALNEIEVVRKLIGEVSSIYLQKEYPDKKASKKYDELVSAAITDMGKDVPTDGADYLAFWQELSKSAVEFISEKKIATLPKNQTLQILNAPESAGPAARIGWVGVSPPFAPNPMTTLYLPSIPETLPKQEQIDFWSSFNKPFNRMIVIHELFPGHYMQMKISRETPHPIRLLFPYGIYAEGWATFCERVLLDAGWEEDDPMTMLAHLRKRIENANRAYTSVQVHCNNWTRDQVMEFSTETSLVAPQFAKSLWGRLMRSPMQLTSYFLGGAQFTELLASEKERLGDEFDLTLFMDTIMISGAIPIDEFDAIFRQSISNN